VIKALIISSLLLIGLNGFGQEGKLIYIHNDDTIPVSEVDIDIYLHLKGDTIKFNEGENLVYPNNIANKDVLSVIVVYKDKSLNFYSKPLMIKNGFPAAVAEVSAPLYNGLFKDKRNMYFIYNDKVSMYDEVPQDHNDKLGIKDNIKGPQVTLYYQVRANKLLK
jgi:hypothetical protein